MGKIISVVTVSYNSENFIEKYITSVQKNLPEDGEIIIFDNNSTDDTLKKLEKFEKSIVLIKSSQNIGFSKGNNKAAQKATGEYLFFLNPDSVIVDGAIDKLIKYAKAQSDIGILSPQLIENDASIQRSVRKEPTLIGAIKEYWLHQENSFEQYVPSQVNAVEVECVYGGAMLIKKDIFEKLKGFDERYFLYYEDLDLCRRVRKIGLKVVYFPEAKIRHSIGGSVTKIEKLPWGIRTIAWFFPLKKYGSRYHQFKGSNIYHGFVISFLITLLIYISVKLKIFKPKEVVTF